MVPSPSDPPPARSSYGGRRAESDAWAAMGLIVSGMLVWGGVGLALSRWLDNPVFVMVGLLLGVGAALYLVWFRYGRPT